MFGKENNGNGKRYYTLTDDDIRAMTAETVRQTVAKINADNAARAKAEAEKRPAAPEEPPGNDAEQAKETARRSWQDLLGLTDPDKVE